MGDVLVWSLYWIKACSQMLLVKRAFSVRQGEWLLLEPLVSGGMQSREWKLSPFHCLFCLTPRVAHGHLGGVCLMATLEECASWPPWRSVPLQFIQATSWNLNEDPRLIIVKWPIKRILKSKYPSKGYSFINFVFNYPLLGSSLYHLPNTELIWASSVTNQIKRQHLW